MELLNSLSFVKVIPLTDEKAEQLSMVKDAVDELNLIKQGKLEGKSARELLNEL